MVMCVKLTLCKPDHAQVSSATLTWAAVSPACLRSASEPATCMPAMDPGPLGGDGPSGPRMDDSDGMGCERSFTPFKTHLAALQLMIKHFIKVRDDS